VRQLALAVIAAAALAGCGPGPDGAANAPTDVSVLITSDFGSKELRDSATDGVPAGETVMRLLERRYDVETKYGGGFVDALEGLSAGRDASGDPTDWFYYVNGIEADEGAASREVSAGDRIWWDRHDWGTAQRVPAVVGSWPEPFLLGQSGKRFPLTIVCAGEERSCDEVQTRLADEGIKDVAQSSVGTNTGAKVLRVLVGPWEAIRADPAAQQLEEGPSVSGVFARPSVDGIDLLDENGGVADSFADSVGLVAATRFGEQQPTWVVTGTDDTGVAAAAAALRTDVLHGSFAVALVDGQAQPLPVREEP
jgi:Domain of unknown function (DUF4430)